MATEPLTRPVAKLYREDFVEWTRETAHLLRSGRFDAIDVEHLAEEIEDMGISHEREVLSRLRVLIVHLLKWRWRPEKRSRSWRSTIDVQRSEIEDVLRRSPSLRPSLSALTAEACPSAVRRASIETGLSRDAFPAECPFSVAQLLNEEFLP